MLLECSTDESGRTTGMSVVPGVEFCSEVVQQNEQTPKTYIFSSNITQDIDQGSFNRGFTQVKVTQYLRVSYRGQGW